MSGATEAAGAAGVRTVNGAHTQAQDAGRTDDIVALYTKDAVLELPGADPIQGHDALREAFTAWAPTKPQLHLVANTVVTSWSDDEATAESDVAFTQRGDTGWAVLIAGHYVDTFVLEDGTWLLQRRSTTYQS
jgi:ketosteroid isomerase-like protein